jgi:GT2 family glycosyltransferase/ubiquinone/menaquinone biosynthesis C-methylase UbiE
MPINSIKQSRGVKTLITSIIILTYNKLQYTKECIDSIRKYTAQGTYEIIVVDNASNDGTVEWLKQQKDIISIYNNENLGFPKGCNQGIDVATGEYILLLNNDVIVTKHWLSNMRKALDSSEKIGAVSVVSNYCSYYQSIPVTYNTLEEMQSFAEGFNVSDSTKWEDRIKLIGFCMLIKKKVVQEIGYLDECFTPGNFEDDDYSFRIILAGYKLVLCKDTFIHHYGSTSFKDRASEYNQLLNTNKTKFKDKWGFDPAYSSFIRSEIINQIDSNPQDNIKILEVGCACGATLLKVKNLFTNADLYGIEFNESSAAIARTFADVKAGDVEKEQLDYPGEFFDYIICADVLEHLYNPWKALETLRKHLKPDGKILISIPNVMHYSLVRDLLNGNWTYQDAGLLDRTHVRFFTIKEFKKMLYSAGYGDFHIGSITLPINKEDQQFLQHLVTAGSKDLIDQYTTYQYIIKAYNSGIKELLDNILLGLNITENVKKLSLVNDTTSILDCISMIDVKHIDLINLLVQLFYKIKAHDHIITLLQAAHKIDPSHQDTIYNMGCILEVLGELELASDWFSKLQDSKYNN